MRAPTSFNPRYTSVLRLTSTPSSLTWRKRTFGTTRTRSENDTVMVSSQIAEHARADFREPLEGPRIAESFDRHAIGDARHDRELPFHPCCTGEPAVERVLDELDERVSRRDRRDA